MRSYFTAGFSMLVLGVLLTTSSPSHAALVSGSYIGTIYDDGGLGLLGQTLTVDFTYDDTTPISFGSYDDPITSATVTIGTNVWTWIPTGGSWASLSDNEVILFAVGEEDRASFFAYEFSGPSLAANVEDYSYTLSIYLNDEEPDGNPDGLTSENLPPVVPDPGLFQYTEFERPLLEFSFISGDAELGEYYFIRANDVSLIPEPAIMSLLGFGGALAIRRRRRRA